MRLDVFSHVYPQRFYDRMQQVLPDGGARARLLYGVPSLHDMDRRFRLMDQFDDYAQIVCMSGPPIESMGGPALACDLARCANDEMAELVARHADRFPGFVAALPMNDEAGLLREAERAIRDLGAVGVQVYTHVQGRPLTAPATLGLFALMAELDRPIWLHPDREASHADYTAESKSHYEIWFAIGWPHETSVAMAHIALSGLFDRHPGLKVIAHQMGGTIPYLEGRVTNVWERLGARTTDEDYRSLRQAMTRRPVDYFRMFYADTVGAIGQPPVECCLDFFGPGHMLFATDAPFGPDQGAGYIRSAIAAVEGLELTAAQRHDIFEGNARRLLKLGEIG
ncbi:Amidohydrolase [Pigmentiphaga humi]|uniref:Amidohydrolase n=1 Tax=Pigmentiphaga humi TaxID=2478468 RepID=A0A3P4B6A3_9BURK|nr:amidohydrolase family protein [Pigmentiphaga humi]VCU71188.1 Amidohydrolase [Pigmentiphaga humi]